MYNSIEVQPKSKRSIELKSVANVGSANYQTSNAGVQKKEQSVGEGRPRQVLRLEYIPNRVHIGGGPDSSTPNYYDIRYTTLHLRPGKQANQDLRNNAGSLRDLDSVPSPDPVATGWGYANLPATPQRNSIGSTNSNINIVNTLEMQDDLMLDMMDWKNYVNDLNSLVVQGQSPRRLSLNEKLQKVLQDPSLRDAAEDRLQEMQANRVSGVTFRKGSQSIEKEGRAPARDPKLQAARQSRYVSTVQENRKAYPKRQYLLD